MTKLNTWSKGDGVLSIDLLISNSKLEANSFETGLSDHMIYTILKTKFEKFEPKKSMYYNFKQYDGDQFKWDICNIMSTMRTHAAFENFLFNFR